MRAEEEARRAEAARRRREAERRGHLAEGFAALALRLRGWRVLARRHRARGGEVDIVARRGRLVAMVEVKARRTLAESVDAVSPTAWRRIAAAGDDWLARRPDATTLSVRYDLVAVPTPIRPWRWPRRIAGAWSPD